MRLCFQNILEELVFVLRGIQVALAETQTKII